MAPPARGLDLQTWTPPAVGTLLLLAVLAFWPTYLAAPARLGTPYTHLHASTATLWFVLLLAQPLLLRAGARRLHRTLGYASVLLAPLVLVGIALGAHSLLGRLMAAGVWREGVYVLYLQASLGAAFGILWGLGMWHRKDRKVHARFMAATGLTFVDPVLARLLPDLPGVGAQVVTFTVVNAILLGLIWNEREARRGRWVFPLVLGVFLLLEIPLALGVTGTGAWEGFARWYLALPLTP